MRKSTLVTLSVFVVLWVVAAWVINREPERGVTRVSFATLDANDVTGIEITGPQPVTLTRRDGVWRLPSGREADPTLINGLTRAAAGVVSSDILTQDSNRFSEYEVDAAHGTHVKLTGRDATLADFTAGRSMPGGAAAVRSGDSVYKVAGLYKAAFVHDANAWLQRRVFGAEPPAAVRLTVALAGKPPYNLVLREGTWGVLQEGDVGLGDMRFDARLGQGLADALVGVQAETILDSDPGEAETGLSATAERLTWYSQAAGAAPTPPAGAEGDAVKQVSHTLILGATQADKNVFAKVEGRPDVYVLASGTVAMLRKDLASLRDLGLMASFDASRVRSLAISDGGKRFVLSRDSEGASWHTADTLPAGFALDPAKVTQRIEAVRHARGQAVAPGVTLASAGLKPPKASVLLTLEDKSAVQVSFGIAAREAPTTVYAQGTADAAVYVASQALRDTLLGTLQSFKQEAEADPLLQLDPKTLSGLPPDVRASLEQQIAQKTRQKQLVEAARQKAP